MNRFQEISIRYLRFGIASFVGWVVGAASYYLMSKIYFLITNSVISKVETSDFLMMFLSSLIGIMVTIITYIYIKEHYPI